MVPTALTVAVVAVMATLHSPVTLAFCMSCTHCHGSGGGDPFSSRALDRSHCSLKMVRLPVIRGGFVGTVTADADKAILDSSATVESPLVIPGKCLSHLHQAQGICGAIDRGPAEIFDIFSIPTGLEKTFNYTIRHLSTGMVYT